MTTFTTDVFERIDKNDVALIVVDHQVGLFEMVRDYTPAEFRNNILAHAALGKLFNIPVVLTTSAETGQSLARWLAMTGQTDGQIQVPTVLCHRRYSICILTLRLSGEMVKSMHGTVRLSGMHSRLLERNR